MYTVAFLIHTIEKIECIDLNILCTGPPAAAVLDEFKQLKEELSALKTLISGCNEQIRLHSTLFKECIVQLEETLIKLEDSMENLLIEVPHNKTTFQKFSSPSRPNNHLMPVKEFLVRELAIVERMREFFQLLGVLDFTSGTTEKGRETNPVFDIDVEGRKQGMKTMLLVETELYVNAWNLSESKDFQEGQKTRDRIIIETGKDIQKKICEAVFLSTGVGSLLRNNDSSWESSCFKKNLLPKSCNMCSANAESVFESLKSCLDHLPANLQLESSCFKKSLFPQSRNICLADAENIFESIKSSLDHLPANLQLGSSCFENHLLPKSYNIRSANAENIFVSLESSLDRLPANLQLGFAYCRLLPKRHDIDLHTLIALWMAQGFINSDFTRSTQTEDAGYAYFNDLLAAKLFHDVQKDEWGNARSCRVPGLLYDVALHVSSNRIILMDPHGETVHERVHHVTLDFNLEPSWQIPNSLLKAQGLRTILLSPQSRLPHEVKLSTSTCHAIFSSFDKLRVLDLHDLGMKTIPKSLGKLKQLRYLDLSKNSFTTLPKSTTSLINLQTLKLSNCHKLKELPESFHTLVNLRHLEIDGCFALTHMPLGLGNLTSLQTLSRFVASKIHSSPSTTAGLEQLVSLNKLAGNLEILHLERAKCNPSNAYSSFLDQKAQLKCVTLRWNRDFDDEEEEKVNPDEGDDETLLEILKPHPNLKALSIMGFKGKFPSGYFTVLNLVKISLYYCPIIEFLPPLHKIPSLEILQLQRLEAMKFVADSSAYASKTSFFPTLKEVTIWDCPCLTSWWGSGAGLPDKTALFPSKDIQKLEIRYCPKLTSIPFYPEELILVCYTMDQLEQIMKKMSERPSTSPSHASSSSSELVHSGLKSLIIGRIEDLVCPPVERLKSFTSLEFLHIQDCHNLKSLSQGIQHLSSLQSLKIENCMELNVDKDEDDGGQWKGLINLRTLTIKGIPKLEALPQGLAHANSLQVLQIYSCPGLMSLPKWIGYLASLDTLTIEDCPKLLPRCQEETGEDWPQIAKIKNRSLK